MTEKQFNEITEWQDKTFGEATSISKLIHLAGENPDPNSEIGELMADIKVGNPLRRLEWADGFLLFFGAAKKDGMSYQDISDAIQEKFEINKKRKWGKPDANGVVSHVKD